METTMATASVHLPRVAITFCTQCRWMLRAAYFGQELLSTFGSSIGEIALVPATGGLFTVHLTYKPPGADGENGDAEVHETLIWDRKTEGGFPETKILKQLIRNHIAPSKDLGHSDKPAKAAETQPPRQSNEATNAVLDSIGAETVSHGTVDPNCEDCR